MLTYHVKAELICDCEGCEKYAALRDLNIEFVLDRAKALGWHIEPTQSKIKLVKCPACVKEDKPYA